MSLPPSPNRSSHSTSRSSKDIARIRGTLGDTVYLIESFTESLNQTANDHQLQRDQVNGLVGSWREEMDTVRRSTDATAKSTATLEELTHQTNERLFTMESNMTRLQTSQEDLQRALKAQADQLQSISTALQAIASRPPPPPVSFSAPMREEAGPPPPTYPPVHVHIPMDTICEKLSSQLERLYAHSSSTFSSPFPMPPSIISSHDQTFPTVVVRPLKRPSPRDDPPVSVSASVLESEFASSKRIRGVSQEVETETELSKNVDPAPCDSPSQIENSSRTMVDIPAPVHPKPTSSQPTSSQPPVYTNTDVDNDADVDVVPPSDDEIEPEVQDEVDVGGSIGQSAGVSPSLTAPMIDNSSSGITYLRQSQRQLRYQQAVKEETIEPTIKRDDVVVERRKDPRETRLKRTLLQPLSSLTNIAHADLHPSETEDEGEGDEEELDLEFDV